MKVAVFSTKSYDKEYLDAYNTDPGHQLTYFKASLNIETVNLTQGFPAVCIFVNDSLNRETLERMAENGVKLIALRCAGFNNVDIEAALGLGISVYSVPSYSPQAVAEYAVALIMTLNRKTHKAYNRVRENNFSLEKLIGFDLFSKTVGVIGTGEIGTAFCRIMSGFGCHILAYDIHESVELQELGVQYVSLEKILSASDIISLHCPLNHQTHHLIDKEGFSKMKRGAMLINTSRGAVINTKDAVEALKTGQLGYLGIDVYEQEDQLFFKDLSETIILDDLIARLMSFPNVLITAHQGFFTKEALGQIAQTTLQNISDFENARPNPNLVKPQTGP